MRRSLTWRTLYFSSSSLASRAFSALCPYLTFRYHPHPVPNFVSVAPSIAELAHRLESRTQSLTHPAYLMCSEPKLIAPVTWKVGGKPGTFNRDWRLAVLVTVSVYVILYFGYNWILWTAESKRNKKSWKSRLYSRPWMLKLTLSIKWRSQLVCHQSVEISPFFTARAAVLARY